MSLDVSFTLNEHDLDHFRGVMRSAQQRAEQVSEEEIVGEARAVLDKVDEEKAPHFVLERLAKLRTMVAMLEDEEWPLEGQERSDVVSALSYFYQPEDIIDDSTPVLGLIDDAIMIELVVRELKHEFDAYEDFCQFRNTEEALRGKDISREDWLDAKRRELFSRMRERMNRRRQGSRGVGRLTRFSFLG
jgi:uncharacterized membrane protein YkvA (DUF1232 family)